MWKMSETITLPRTSRRLEEQEEQQTKRQPPYNVILLNDDDHSFEYVIEMLQKLFGHPPEKGFRMLRRSTPRAG
jgi:ATP-dependent Clp protease adaptor protein ClpS